MAVQVHNLSVPALVASVAATIKSIGTALAKTLPLMSDAAAARKSRTNSRRWASMQTRQSASEVAPPI